MIQNNLAGECRELGWLPIPVECPTRFRNKILERRSAMLAHPENLPRRSHASAVPVRLTTAELRRQCHQIGLDIEAERLRARIEETNMVVQCTDENGNISFRAATDAEWTASLRSRAAAAAATIRADRLEEARRHPWVWSVREGAYVNVYERLLKEQNQ